MAFIDHAVLARSGDDLAKLRYALAGIAQNATDGFHRFLGDDNDHPDPTVEGAQQFELGDVALFGEPLKTGSTGTRGRSIPTPRCFGNMRGMLSVNPPPVIWASALTASVSRIARRHDLT